jgi:hypothetical protein
VESNGKHYDDNGKVKGSSAGWGLMGLSDDAGKEVGENPQDPEQNWEGGLKYLDKQYEKYGNWPDAVAAYNWGPAKLDKWKADGSDPAKMPDSVQKYVGKVLYRSGMVDDPSTSFVKAKRNVATQTMADRLGDWDKTPDEAAEDMPTADGAPTPELPTGELNTIPVPEIPDNVKSLFTGAERSVRDLLLGPTQVGLEAVDPAAATRLTNTINQMDLRGDKVMRDYPGWGTAGSIVGTVGGIMGATALIPEIEVPTGIAQISSILARTPTWLKAGAGGFALGATQYDPEERGWGERGIEGLIGMAWGGLGHTISTAVMKAVGTAASSEAYQKSLQVIRTGVGELEQHVSALKQSFLANYRKLDSDANEAFTIRDATGKPVTGWDIDNINDALDVSTAVHKAAGVDLEAAGAIAHAKENLGIPAEMQRRAAHQKLVDEYEEEASEVAARRKELVDKYVSQSTPGVKLTDAQMEQIRQVVEHNLDSRGMLPRGTKVRPEPHEPAKVSAAQYSTAMQGLTRARGSSLGKNPARYHQITSAIRALERAAADEAEDLGIDAERFMSESEHARDLFSRTIGPIRDAFGKLTPEQMEAKYSPTEFYNRVVRIVERNDPQRIGELAKMGGPQFKEAIGKMLLYRSMTVGQTADRIDPAKMARYIEKNEKAIRQLLPRDQAEEAIGRMKLAQNIGQVVNSPAKQREHAGWFSYMTHGWGIPLTLERVAHGEYLWAAGIVGMHMIYPMLSRITRVLPSATPMLRRLSKVDPNGSAANNLTRQILVPFFRALPKAAARAPTGGSQSLNWLGQPNPPVSYP